LCLFFCMPHRILEANYPYTSRDVCYGSNKFGSCFVIYAGKSNLFNTSFFTECAELETTL
jgi:hypothetical protein